MAIDMIENNELGALSVSRAGGFANDDRYSNLFGLNWDVAGIKTSKRKTQEAQAQRTAEYSVDPNQANDCNYLEQRLQEIKNKIQFELAKNPNKKARQRYLDPLYGAENTFKNLVLALKCEEKKAKAEDDRLKKETEEAIRRTAMDTPTIPDVKVAQGSPATKIILIGVGVLVVAVIGVALFRKSN